MDKVNLPGPLQNLTGEKTKLTKSSGEGAIEVGLIGEEVRTGRNTLSVVAVGVAVVVGVGAAAAAAVEEAAAAEEEVVGVGKTSSGVAIGVGETANGAGPLRMSLVGLWLVVEVSEVVEVGTIGSTTEGLVVLLPDRAGLQGHQGLLA